MGEETSIEAESARRAEAIRQGCAAFLIYLALACWFFGRGLIGHFSDRFIGRETDPPQMMWLLSWWPYALSHHLNPFLTDYVWAPVGFNFAWMTSTPLASILAIPLTKKIGLVGSLNVLTVLGAPTAAFSAFILCRRICHCFWPSILGGFVFGFSSYMMSQTLGHLNLILVFPLPIAVYLVVRWFEGSLSDRAFTSLLAVTLVCEFLIDMEILTMGTLIASVSFAAAMYYSSREGRRKLARLIPLTAVAYVITAILVSPYLYYFLFFGSIHQPFWPSEQFSTDLLNFVLPTEVNLLGTVGFIANTTVHFPGSSIERGGFIALPVLVISIAWARANWRAPFGKALVIPLVVVMVAAIGPYLQVDGCPLVPMPWLVLTHVPLLQQALPSRLMLFPPLAFAIIVSLWLAAPENSQRTKAFAAALMVALMVPNLSSGFWTSPVDTPAFFTDGSAGKNLSRRDVVLTLPWGVTGNSMLWQAECGMCFRNVSGYTAMERFEVRRWPIVNFFLGSRGLPDSELQLKEFLANNGVSAIVIDDANPSAARWKDLVARLGIKSRSISGVSLYQIRPDALEDLKRLTGLAMEQRAIQARFDILVSAVDGYLSAGHSLESINADRIVDLGFLPAVWKGAPHRFNDFFVFPWSNKYVVIGVLGSPGAINSLIERYRKTASEIYLPFPKIVAGAGDSSALGRFFHNVLLPPATSPVDGESLRFLGIAFERERLHEAIEFIARAHPPISDASLAGR